MIIRARLDKRPIHLPQSFTATNESMPTSNHGYRSRQQFTPRGFFTMATNSSQRPTREWPLLVLALALVCAICIPLWQLSASKGDAGNDWSKWTPERVSRLLLG